ncbi:hypothetical protein [Acetobacter estunensis]|uniref:hypothetical protein n=1 Tax=Acetobacter estunensis TaxID=104097 RepID=UPI001C2D4625|nr:hypothetical protein [Acetobacter estunensis]MBV1835658.1 hypothetical protein [Acetobacter estunensis]MBV1836081.1 hypothetical protein [Acetobacter estunensis]
MNWETLPADLSQFYTGWTRTELEGLTGSELIQVTEDANRISAHQKREAEKARQAQRC